MFEIRPIEKKDNPFVKKIILDTLIEFGATGGGFASSDAEIDDMFKAYQKDRTQYFVIDKDSKIYGGAGIAPLLGKESQYCELQKMYFLPETRGQGLGLKMIKKCIEAARSMNFDYCYLETLSNMEAAQKLYKKVGFTQLDKPLGETGHFGCNTFFILNLKE